jgi:hypothetical protein
MRSSLCNEVRVYIILSVCDLEQVTASECRALFARP